MDEVLPSGHWASFGYSLSARLRSLRDMRGISQVRLAELAGLSRSLVSNLERNHSSSEGSSDPTMSTIYRLSYALRVPPAVLLPAAGEEVGGMCWEAIERAVGDGPGVLNTSVSWPARPEDTQPFTPAP
nr:helix-turn-helix transcriptional regulator [Corynebacterium urinipleomorphum]